MSLPLLVYLVENLSYSGNFFVPIFILAGIGAGTISAFLISEKIPENEEKDLRKVGKTLTTVAIVSVILHILLPTKRTVYLMAGAYMVEQVIDSPEAKELGTLSYSAVKNQLILWAESEKEIAPQLKSMVETLDKSAGLSQQ